MADVPDGVFEHGASAMDKRDDSDAGWELCLFSACGHDGFGEEVVCACREEDGRVEVEAGVYGSD